MPSRMLPLRLSVSPDPRARPRSVLAKQTRYREGTHTRRATAGSRFTGIPSALEPDQQSYAERKRNARQ